MMDAMDEPQRCLKCQMLHMKPEVSVLGQELFFLGEHLENESTT